VPDVRRPDLYGPGRSLTANARGFRALEEHAPEVPADRYRVVCLGDPFTMGYGVDDADTYPARVQRHCPALQADRLLFAFVDADLNRLGLDAFGGFPKPRLDPEAGELVVRNVPVPRVGTTRSPG
jgi:hypothetical protein